MGIVVELLPLFLSVIQQAPQIASDISRAWDLIVNQHGATDEQKQQMTDALDAAHQALQQSTEDQAGA